MNKVRWTQGEHMIFMQEYEKYTQTQQLTRWANWISCSCQNTNTNITTRKNYDQKKKRYSRLAGHVFRRVQITTGKNYDPKKKRYSRLADGLNKSQITVCRVKIQTPIITKLEKIRTWKKKGTVVWSSVGAQNTKHNTHRHNIQQDEPCHPTLQRLCSLSLHG